MEFKDARSAIIPKPKKPAYDVPKAFRPIALLNTLGKLLTKVLARRLQFDGQAFGLFHEGQFGGISQHATTDVGLVLVDNIAENRDRGLHTLVLALDIAQFFPSIHHGVLRVMLTKLGFNERLVQVISSLLEDRSTTYRWDGISTDTHFQCSDGVPQGDPLSPVLSALYLSLIVKRLFPWNYERWVNSLFFVDDGTIIVSSFSLDDNIFFLSLFYKHFLCLLANIGLTVEQSKLELKHFIAFNPTGPRRSFVLIDQPSLTYTWKGKEYTVKPQEIWRYLGFFLTLFLSSIITYDIILTKALAPFAHVTCSATCLAALGPSSDASATTLTSCRSSPTECPSGTRRTALDASSTSALCHEFKTMLSGGSRALLRALP